MSLPKPDQDFTAWWQRASITLRKAQQAREREALLARRKPRLPETQTEIDA